MHLSSLNWNMASPPGGNSPAVAGHNRILAQPLSQFVRDHLRLHWGFASSSAVFHDFPPLSYSLLCCFQKVSVGLALESRQQFAQHTTTVSDQTDFHRKSQTNPFGVQLDLHAFSVARPR